ncbi:MAG: hypothetical protein RSC07_03140 [Mucinivorans sp.]
MKKSLLFSLIAVAAMVVSCGSPKVYTDAMNSVSQSIVKLDSVQTLEQLQAFSMEFSDATSQFTSNPDWAKISETEKAAFSAKMDSLQMKMTAIGQDLSAKAAAEAEAAAAAAAAEAEAAAEAAKSGKRK